MNANTIANALANNNPRNAACVLTNPGGNNPWLFTYNPPGSNPNSVPCALEVPCVQGEAQDVGSLTSIPLAAQEAWYADGLPFIVRAFGKVSPLTTGQSLRLYLFYGNGLGSGVAGAQADVEIALFTGTLPLGVLNSNWLIEARCLWDSASLQLNVSAKAVVGGVLVGETAVTLNNPTAWVAQQAAGSYNPLAFVVAANLPAELGAATVTMTQFYADLL